MPRAGKESDDKHSIREALKVSDAVLRSWIVRIPCGVFAIMLVAGVIHTWVSREASQILLPLALTTSSIPVVLDCGRIAFGARSKLFGYLLAGLPIGAGESAQQLEEASSSAIHD